MTSSEFLLGVLASFIASSLWYFVTRYRKNTPPSQKTQAPPTRVEKSAFPEESNQTYPKMEFEVTDEQADQIEALRNAKTIRKGARTLVSGIPKATYSDSDGKTKIFKNIDVLFGTNISNPITFKVFVDDWEYPGKIILDLVEIDRTSNIYLINNQDQNTPLQIRIEHSPDQDTKVILNLRDGSYTLEQILESYKLLFRQLSAEVTTLREDSDQKREISFDARTGKISEEERIKVKKDLSFIIEIYERVQSLRKKGVLKRISPFPTDFTDEEAIDLINLDYYFNNNRANITNKDFTSTFHKTEESKRTIKEYIFKKTLGQIVYYDRSYRSKKPFFGQTLVKQGRKLTISDTKIANPLSVYFNVFLAFWRNQYTVSFKASKTAEVTLRYDKIYAE